jgi:hypothetical protein
MRRDDILGAWQLQDFRLIDAEGRVTRPWGKGSQGLILYTSDGYMSAAVKTEDRNGTSFLNYCGPFELGEDRIVHHIRLSSDPKLVGTDQVRRPRLDGGNLILSSSPSLYGGPGTRAEIVWRRT